MNEKEMTGSPEEALEALKAYIGSVYVPDALVVAKCVDTLRQALAEREDLELCKELVKLHVEVATPYFQCGGKYASMIRPGGNIIVDGLPALSKAYEEIKHERDDLQKKVAELESFYERLGKEERE